MEEIIIRRKTLEAKLGLSCSTIYALMAKGKFPRPVKLGIRAVGWKSEDIKRWVEERNG